MSRSLFIPDLFRQIIRLRAEVADDQMKVGAEVTALRREVSRLEGLNFVQAERILALETSPDCPAEDEDSSHL